MVTSLTLRGIRRKTHRKHLRLLQNRLEPGKQVVHSGVVGSWERGLPPSRRASVSASLRRDRAEAEGEGGIAPLRRDGGQAASA